MKSLSGETAARALPTWQKPHGNDGGSADAARSGSLDADRKARFVAHEQQASRQRSACFAGLKLRNPTWDMLVALFAAKTSGRQLSMSDLCLMCDAPESTALRLIHQLREKGYAEMVPDRSDRRRTRVSLTALGEAQFDDYLSQKTIV